MARYNCLNRLCFDEWLNISYDRSLQYAHISFKWRAKNLILAWVLKFAHGKYRNQRSVTWVLNGMDVEQSDQIRRL